MDRDVTTHTLLAPKFSRGRAVHLATLRACLTCHGTSCCLHVHNTQAGVQNFKFKSLNLYLLLICSFSVYFTMMSVPQNYNFDTRIIDVMINSKRNPGLYEVPFCLETFCGSIAQNYEK